MKPFWCQELAVDDFKGYGVFSPEKLTRMREKMNLDQIQMAFLFGVKVGTYRSWEYGKRKMPRIYWKYFNALYRSAIQLYAKKFPKLPWPPGGSF